MDDMTNLIENSNKLTILVVDDTPDSIEVLNGILSPTYRVKVALDGKKALEIAMSNDPPDLILLDIMMPVMDGYEVCTRLKADKKAQSIPIIFLTSKDDVEDETKGLELGAVDYITKPISAPVVYARIKRHLKTQMDQRRLEQQAQKLLQIIREEKADNHKELERNYEILGLIGKGGMAEVYRVRHRTLGRLMALKILVPPNDNKAWSTRFMREAQILAKIQHPNVVAVYDAGIIGKYAYIAMELIEGTDLEKLREQSPMPSYIIHNIITQAAKGIGAVHAHNIVHRDIKPSNFLINKQQIVKVTDFGISKDLNQAKLTQPGLLVGTPVYMSPEQCKGSDVDPRSDIYSLGITLFFLLTGQVPFNSENPITTLCQILRGQIPDPRSYCNVPEYLCPIVSKMTRKLPEDRYQTIDKLLEELAKSVAI